MDNKSKIKTELKSKLKQEMSMTGTGASVTPGDGMGVATKYAFKKKVKEDAPQLAGGKVKDVYAVSHFGFKEAPSKPNRPSKAIDYKELWEENENEDVLGDMISDMLKYMSKEEVVKHLQQILANATSDNLQEGYAQFRNETKMRSKPDQFHQAVKQIKRKMNEINRIFEYVDRLKSELSEGEDLKYKKYTENAFTQIKESAKQLFLKSTKLK